MATSYTDTTTNNLIINKMTKTEYDNLTAEQKAANELFLVEEAIDVSPGLGSTNPVMSGGVYTALQGKEDRSVIIVPESGTTAIHGILGSYYRFDEVVNTLTITLPTVSDTTKIQGIIFFFTTGSTPAITITTANSAAISYFEGYIINPGVTYELNAIFNGLKWIISYARII